jgi:hypothetical protein
VEIGQRPDRSGIADGPHSPTEDEFRQPSLAFSAQVRQQGGREERRPERAGVTSQLTPASPQNDEFAP